MLWESDLHGLHNQLDAFIRDSKQHHDTHLQLLHRCQELVESYRHLKSDLEGERESREKYVYNNNNNQTRGQVSCLLSCCPSYYYTDLTLEFTAESVCSRACRWR